MSDKPIKKDLITGEWLKKAKDDELNAASILRHRDGTPNGVCFLSHQMAEKCLKAFLVQEKKEYPKIHSLLKLTELCAKIDKSFVEIKDEVIFLNTFYAPVRYPGDYPEFSWQEAEEAFKMAEQIRDFVLSKLK
ncbi:MAG: HEPN domain-containing protein [Patescibacteria group bacterium]|nr:HEPN domain-containing protein [Patescibacteria group bacterium]MBU4141674.1 HEPN domain-containing protein [Patescibacteria group bacterium]